SRTDTTTPPRPNFSFAADKAETPGLVQGNTESIYPGSSGAGSDFGFTQTGGGLDYGINYGLRNNYVVQADAVQTPDRIDITSGPVPGTIFTQNSLSVFFRGHTDVPANQPHVNNVSLFTQIIDPVSGAVVNHDVPVRGQ